MVHLLCRTVHLHAERHVLLICDSNCFVFYVMQAVVYFSCLGDKCLSHAKLMSTAP